MVLREAAKKITVFFSGPAIKALPPPLELSGHKFFSRIFLELQKTVFFLVAKPSPPLLVATKKTRYFFATSLTEYIFVQCSLNLSTAQLSGQGRHFFFAFLQFGDAEGCKHGNGVLCKQL